MPPLTVLTHHPERHEPAPDREPLPARERLATDSETVTVTHDDGTTITPSPPRYAYVQAGVTITRR